MELVEREDSHGVIRGDEEEKEERKRAERRRVEKAREKRSRAEEEGRR